MKLHFLFQILRKYTRTTKRGSITHDAMMAAVKQVLEGNKSARSGLKEKDIPKSMQFQKVEQYKSNQIKDNTSNTSSEIFHQYIKLPNALVTKNKSSPIMGSNSHGSSCLDVRFSLKACTAGHRKP